MDLLAQWLDSCPDEIKKSAMDALGIERTMSVSEWMACCSQPCNASSPSLLCPCLNPCLRLHLFVADVMPVHCSPIRNRLVSLLSTLPFRPRVL